MFDEKLLKKIYGHPRIKDVPLLFLNEVIKAIEEVLESDAKEHPMLYLAFTFNNNISEYKEA